MSGGYVIKKVPTKPTYSQSLFADESDREAQPELVNDEVAYFMPGAAEVVPTESADMAAPLPEPLPPEPENLNYFPPDDLSPIMTEQSVVLIPADTAEGALWQAASAGVQIDAWFAGSDESGHSTIFIDGAALQEGDTWEEQHDGQTYRFAFKGIEDDLVTLVALERVPATE